MAEAAVLSVLQACIGWKNSAWRRQFGCLTSRILDPSLSKAISTEPVSSSVRMRKSYPEFAGSMSALSLRRSGATAKHLTKPTRSSEINVASGQTFNRGKHSELPLGVDKSVYVALCPGRNRTVSKRANEIRAVRLAPGEAYPQSYSKSVGLTPDGTEMESVAHQQGFVRKLSVLERPLLAQSGRSGAELGYSSNRSEVRDLEKKPSTSDHNR